MSGMRYMALSNRGSNTSRVCFLLENVESMAGQNGDCRSKQGRDPHSAAKEIENQKSASKRSPKIPPQKNWAR